MRISRAMTSRTLSLSALALLSTGVFVAVACGGTPAPMVPEVTPPVASDSAKPVDTAPPSVPASASSAAAAPAKMTAADCDKLVEEANVELDAERIKVDKVCKKDADCIGIRGRACTFTCQNGSIPKAEQAEWDKEVANVKDHQCKKWSENECSKISPPKNPPTCADDAKKPSCNKGKCILK